MLVLSSYVPRSKVSLTAVTVIAVVVLLSMLPGRAVAFGANTSSQQIQPLDPLTPAEIELAGQVASADRRVKAAIGGGKQRLVQVQFLALKPAGVSADPERLQIGRHAAVLFYRYDGDQGIHVVVDLEKKAVVSVTRIEGRAVPLSPEEVSEAFALAARNERVRALLGSRLNEFKVANLAAGERPQNRVEGLRIVATSPRDPCYRHRCIDLLFHTSDGYIVGNTVTVDLTAQTVRAERTIR
jgi:Cu2+-containing amine oxidase